MPTLILGGYLELATALLDDACRLFAEGRYYSALHLAGAADELFGAIVDHKSRTTGSKVVSAFREKVKIMGQLMGVDVGSTKAWGKIADFLNHPRNAVKHFMAEGDAALAFDPLEAARERIEMAALGYRRATGDFIWSEAYQRYSEAVRVVGASLGDGPA